ncbi:MAG: hypothetical protein H6710_09090 [Myxococcales bacterium]|nr:hypothetical protein [Myxococcales bacterium]
MGGLSLVTLGLGVLRELTIASELRASGDADLFFRGLVVIGTTRGFTTALFRARWIPVPLTVAARRLLAAELVTCGLVTAIALATLALLVGAAALAEPTLWAFALAIPLAVFGSATRALAERAGHERRGFLLEWALPLGATVGALLVPGTALGPTLGILVGLVIGGLALLPSLVEGEASSETGHVAAVAPGRTRVLLIDALVYANLGLLDAGLSHLFAAGGFALLNYAYLFVNTVLMAPTAAATVVGLRLSAGGDPATHAALRRWAVIGGLACGALVAGVGLAMMWAPVATRVDAAVGWALAGPAAALVLYSAPFAGLRLANTIGRQFVLANAPARVIGWDVGGLAGRALILGVGAAIIGLPASPLGLAFAELVQIGAWWKLHAPKSLSEGSVS